MAEREQKARLNAVNNGGTPPEDVEPSKEAVSNNLSETSFSAAAARNSSVKKPVRRSLAGESGINSSSNEVLLHALEEPNDDRQSLTKTLKIEGSGNRNSEMINLDGTGNSSKVNLDASGNNNVLSVATNVNANSRAHRRSKGINFFQRKRVLKK